MTDCDSVLSFLRINILMKDTVYPEDAEIARLERILGKGAQYALQEYGFEDLLRLDRVLLSIMNLANLQVTTA